MASHAKESVRWVRTLVAAVAVEIVLIAVTIALFAAYADPNPTLDLVIPPAALILFVPAGYWVGRGSAAPILNGFVAGLWGVVLYVLLTLLARGAVADFDLESSVRPAYLLAHGLKVVGGVLGGWLAARAGSPPAA